MDDAERIFGLLIDPKFSIKQCLFSNKSTEILLNQNAKPSRWTDERLTNERLARHITAGPGEEGSRVGLT